MNILFINTNLSLTGGTERVSTILANNLSRKGYKITMLSLFDGCIPFYSLDDEIKNINIYDNKVNLKKNYIDVIFKIRKVIKNINPDVVVTVESMSCLYTIPALINFRIKHICWEHFNFNNSLGQRGRDFARKLAARYCQHIVTLTERDKDSWIDNLNVKYNIISIPNPNPFISENPNFLLKENIVLSVGRLTHVKGFDSLLKSWAMVKKSYIKDDWLLYIVGDGEDLVKLKIVCSELGIEDSVVFTGKVDNVQDYYRKSKLYCLSSRQEGFPMVLLEAFSFGLPVVSFDCETGPSEILSNTRCLLIENQNINSLAVGLLSMINNESNLASMSKECITKSAEYSIDNIIPIWEKLFLSK